LNYTLFLGNRIGYEALNILLKEKINIHAVYVDIEHAHENEKYFSRTIQLCKDSNITVSTNLKTDAIYEGIIGAVPDIIMCFGYRRYLPRKIYQLAKMCSVGTHFALLPKYR
jgi:methionyl-tRNA formyltransferase